MVSIRDKRYPQSRNMEPISATETKKTWTPVEVEYGKIGIRGGWSSQSFLVETLVLDTPQLAFGSDQSTTFVRAHKNADWLLKTTCGSDGKKGSAKHCKVFDIILKHTVDGDGALKTPAVAEGDGETIQTGSHAVDPMLELDCDETPELKTPQKKTKVRQALQGHTCRYNAASP